MCDNHMYVLKTRREFRHRDVRLSCDDIDQEIAVWFKLAATARPPQRAMLQRTGTALMRRKLNRATRAHSVSLADLPTWNSLLV